MLLGNSKKYTLFNYKLLNKDKCFIKNVENYPNYKKLQIKMIKLIK